jgi:hypothetical protein
MIWELKDREHLGETSIIIVDLSYQVSPIG